MSRLDPQKWTQKQVARTSAASGDYAEGIRSTDKDPMALATAAIPKWKIRVNEADTEKKLRAGLGRVTKGQWQDAAINKGASRLGPGIQAAAPKVLDFATQMSSHIQQGLSTIEKMPSTTYEERKARATAMMDHNHKFQRR